MQDSLEPAIKRECSEYGMKKATNCLRRDPFVRYTDQIRILILQNLSFRADLKGQTLTIGLISPGR